MIQIAATLGLLTFVTGCAAPGSGIVQIAVTGTLLDATSKPIAGRNIDLCLPKEYGLAGLDAKWGQPENYGHRDQKATVVTSSQGVFTNTFNPVSYSMVFWLLPPLGGFPRHPPEPFVFLRFPPVTNEYWSVWAKQEGFDNRVGVPDRAQWLPQSPTLPAKISGTLRQTTGTGNVPQYVVDMTVQLLGEGDQKTGANQAPEDTARKLAEPQR